MAHETGPAQPNDGVLNWFWDSPALMAPFTALYNRAELAALVVSLQTAPRHTTVVCLGPQPEVERDLCMQLEASMAAVHCVVPYTISVHSQLPTVFVVRMQQSEEPVRPVGPSKEVLVDHVCGCAVLRGASVYAPGVVGITKGVSKGERVGVYLDVRGLYSRGSSSFSDGQRIFVGNGVVTESRHQFWGIERPTGVYVHMTEPITHSASLRNTRQLMLQNLPSAMVPYVLDARPQELILDMCAAPGGKAAHLAILAPAAQVVAMERNKPRAERMRRYLLEEVGLQNITVLQADATKQKLYGDAAFDRILLDAPCSSLGQRPRFVCPERSVDRLAGFSAYQQKLFTHAVRLLKPGGTLVYSTCTFAAEENEGVVVWALATFPKLTLVPAEPRLGQPGLSWPGLDDRACRMVQRFRPDNPQMDTIGFFCAKFQLAKQ